MSGHAHVVDHLWQAVLQFFNHARFEVTTGQFTIPLMKRFGYKPAFAGGVEATASMGGRLMPPVMGAVARIGHCLIVASVRHDDRGLR